MVYQKPWQAAVAGMFIGLESQFLDICKKIVPALHQHYGYKPRAREIRFFEEHIHADEIHGSKGFAIVEKYCNTPELQALAIKADRRSDGAALALHERHLLVRACTAKSMTRRCSDLAFGTHVNHFHGPSSQFGRSTLRKSKKGHHEDSHRRRRRSGLVRRPAMKSFPMARC